jgi:hypothetical protein
MRFGPTGERRLNSTGGIQWNYRNNVDWADAAESGNE